jgi:hypothetical protein
MTIHQIIVKRTKLPTEPVKSPLTIIKEIPGVKKEAMVIRMENNFSNVHSLPFVFGNRA